VQCRSGTKRGEQRPSNLLSMPKISDLQPLNLCMASPPGMRGGIAPGEGFRGDQAAREHLNRTGGDAHGQQDRRHVADEGDAANLRQAAAQRCARHEQREDEAACQYDSTILNADCMTASRGL